jgi:TRAP-type C4-dicarboxylate transport system permease small subunit
MKTLDRTLLTLVLAIAIALGWSWVSRTGWAASVSTIGVGQDFDNALQPIIKVAAAIIVMVAATQLVQKAHGFISQRVLGRGTEPSRKSVRLPSS